MVNDHFGGAFVHYSLTVRSERRFIYRSCSNKKCVNIIYVLELGGAGAGGLNSFSRAGSYCGVGCPCFVCCACTVIDSPVSSDRGVRSGSGNSDLKSCVGGCATGVLASN